MNFNKKLQELRKQKGLTQEELADKLYVSRTAVSKWESGRGYPNIDSLKAIAGVFSVTVDGLLSNDELLSLAEEENKQKKLHFYSILFGMLDISCIMLFFLPFFGQKADGLVQAVSLLSLTWVSLYLKTTYSAFAVINVLFGVLTLAMQNCINMFWVQHKSKISLAINIAGVLLFIIGQQTYAAAFLFVFLIIKVLILIKGR